MKGVKYHIKEFVKTECGPILGCPQIYAIVKTECGPVFGCPAIFNDPENNDVYLIVGKQMEVEEFEGLAGKVGVGETVIAVPKSLVDKLSERK